MVGAEPLEVVGDPAFLVRGEDIRLIGDGLVEHGFAFGDDLPRHRAGDGRDQGQGCARGAANAPLRVLPAPLDGRRRHGSHRAWIVP